jgi:hypothetical protein
LNRVQNQVQDDLLQLNTIPRDRKQPLGEAGLERDSVLDNFASRQSDYFADRGIEIETIVPRTCLPDVVAGPADDVSGSIGIAHDAAECFPDFSQVWRALGQKV